ncbi:MAG: T9SS type A sorting domain-containing protein [Candidatus Latescibacterota bacterium]|nr:MAG: T9SS type A sorting domain-containing protein [Candidatus Latescibacterota bacterium]
MMKMRRNGRRTRTTIRLMVASVVLIAGLGLGVTSYERSGLVLPGLEWNGVCAADFAFVTTTDYTTGASSVIRLDGSYSVDRNVAALHSDAVARYYDHKVFVVNRYLGDNIQILDPASSFSTLRQFTVGTSSDPHDIAVLSDTKAYVTRYNESVLWIVDPSTGAQTGSVDLSGLADGDGTPEMDQMAVVGGRVFVTIQRLDRSTTWGPVGDSYVAVIDAAADTLVDVDSVTAGNQSILLAGSNPASDIQLDPCAGKLYVSCVGFWGLQDGGVEVIDPSTLQSEGFLFTEASAGGDVNDVEIVCAEKGYAIITDASFNTSLIAFDPATGTKTGILYAPGDFVLNDIEVSPQRELFLADRTATRPGIRIYSTITDDEITVNPIDVGLPPFDISFSAATQTGLDTHTPGPASLGHNYPNPFNPQTTIPFTLDRAAVVEVSIFDASGRHVRGLLNEFRAPGPNTIVWDGRDDMARPVSSGVYFARMKAGGHTATRKLVLIK